MFFVKDSLPERINQYLSAFTITETNLGAGKMAQDEIKLFRKRAPL